MSVPRHFLAISEGREAHLDRMAAERALVVAQALGLMHVVLMTLASIISDGPTCQTLFPDHEDGAKSGGGDARNRGFMYAVDKPHKHHTPGGAAEYLPSTSRSG